MRFLLLLVVGLFGAASPVFATILSEDIGELKIQDLLLRPSFMFQEGREGDFSIGESSVALRWELEKKYFGVIRIGPRTLLNPTARYTPTVNDDIVLVEAYAEYDDVYGRFRMGRLPVNFGYEGGLWERQLVFPRSMLFSKRVMMLRDEGVSYDIDENNWYTGFVVHNGESGPDLDGRAWYTARWGYKNDAFDLGVAGQTGSTRPESTLNSGDTLAGVDPTQNEKWRFYGLYANVLGRKWEWALEAYMGELQQSDYSARLATGHTDFSYMWSKTFSTHFRFDYFDPNLKVDTDSETQLSLALMFSNPTHSSNLILIGTKDIQQGTNVHDDQIRLIWSLSPAGIVRF